MSARSCNRCGQDSACSVLSVPFWLNVLVIRRNVAVRKACEHQVHVQIG
jgi:hypothetical protein